MSRLLRPYRTALVLSAVVFVPVLVPTAWGEGAPAPAAAANAKPAAVTFQADPIIINANGDEEATLFALPTNSPKVLVDKKLRIEDVRAKLKVRRAQLVEVLKKIDFDKPSAATATLTAAIDEIRGQVAELEAMEADYVLDRDLFVADTAKPAAGEKVEATPATPAH